MLADSLGLDVSSVRLVARVIREAGHLTTGPRGVNAPHMTHADAARMVLAILTGEPPSRVVSAYCDLRSLETFPDPNNPSLLRHQNLDGRPIENLEDHLTWVLRELSKPEPSEFLLLETARVQPSFRAHIEVEQGHRLANMLIGGKWVEFVRKDSAAAFRAASRKNSFPVGRDAETAWQSRPPGMQVKRSVGTDELLVIAKAIGEGSNDLDLPEARAGNA